MKLPALNRSLLSLKVHQWRLDIVILAFLLIEASLISYAGSQLINPVILKDYTEDVWFGADIERVFANLTNAASSYDRIKVHPLFPILAFPIVKLLMLWLGLPPTEAVRIFVAATTAVWAGLLFVTLRLIGCRRLDAALFGVLLLSSAATLFWTVIPETFLLGSVTMLAALCFAALNQSRQQSWGWCMVVSALTLSVTTTNWMVGLAATAVTQTWRRSLWITAGALGLVMAVWRIQHRFFPTAPFFIGNFGEEAHYFLPAASGGPLRVLSGFMFHPIVMPALKVIPSNRNQPDWPMLSVQLANPGSGGFFGAVSIGLWVAMLLLGLWSCFAIKQHLPFRLVLGAGLLGQLSLYLVYGEETFLYATHIAPFLLGACALCTLTRFRIVTLLLTVLLIVNVSLNNSIQFAHAAAFLNHTGPLREAIAQPVSPKTAFIHHSE
jgi:hypothetical protein